MILRFMKNEKPSLRPVKILHTEILRPNRWEPGGILINIYGFSLYQYSDIFFLSAAIFHNLSAEDLCVRRLSRNYIFKLY